MFNRFCKFNWLCLFLVGCGCLCIGCQPANDREAAASAGHHHEHEEGQRPESYEQAVQKIETWAEEIASAFSRNAPKESDAALHELGEVLQQLPEIAGDSSLNKVDWQAVKEAGERLFEIYGRLDGTIHAPGDQQQEPAQAFSQEQSAIESALAVLREKVPLSVDTTGVPKTTPKVEDGHATVDDQVGQKAQDDGKEKR